MVLFKLNNFCTKVNANYKPKQLYKYLIRQCQKLPKGPKEHYAFAVKQGFKQHVNETDPQRIHQIITRSLEDADWILKKYLGNKSK